MCGIFGMIGTLSEENYSEAHELLTNIFKASVARGSDSAGFSAVHFDRPGMLVTDKRPLASPKYVNRASKFKALKKDMPNILIGHTRYSTSGNPKRNRNNHPFNGRRWTLVHNGGISAWQSASRQLEISMRTETDSEILLHMLEQEENPHVSVQNMITKVGTGSRIAIAAIDHSSDEPKLLLFRNPSNDIYIMSHVGFNVIFFASTKEILLAALDMTFAAYASEHVERNKVEIDNTTSYLSMLLSVNKHDGAPYVCSEKSINRVVTPVRTTYLPTVSKSNSSSTSSSVGATDKSKSVYDAIKSGKVSKETKTSYLRLSRITRTSATVIRSIRNNEFMTPEEIRDYEEWKHLV
jgi:glucosamine 6-phosphate synthetase-like amidotransferase/phosphosugar isomerase protein